MYARSGVQGLLEGLLTEGVRWLLPGTTRHGLISERQADDGGWYHGTIMDETLQRALADELVTLGEPEPVPEYDHGRGQWRYEEGLKGKPISITEAGRKAYIER